MFVILNKDESDLEEGKASINTELVTCVVQKGDDVDVYFTGDSEPLELANTTVEDVLSKWLLIRPDPK